MDKMHFRIAIKNDWCFICGAVIYDDNGSRKSLQIIQEPDQEFRIIKGRDQDTDFQQFE